MVIWNEPERSTFRTSPALPNAPSYLDPYANCKAKARQKLSRTNGGMITAEADYAYNRIRLVEEYVI
ncbi:MAG: hypothetical protein ACLR5T_08135 [Veillonella sp.]